MGLGTYLLGMAIEKAAPTIAEVAVKTTVGITAVAAGGATMIAGGVAEQVSKSKKTKKRISSDKKQVNSAEKNYSDYDVNLACAKVAICSYIIHADHKVSDAEEKYIGSIFESIKSEYGSGILKKTKQAFTSCSESFMNVQDYLRRVDVKDIKQYLQAADEVSLVDGYDEKENVAIQRIKDYVNEMEVGTSNHLVCSSCGGKLVLDDYGYKATCNYCGEELVIDSSNAPNRNQNEKNDVDKKNVSSKKKGKIARKVALGVVTGGVSLIPDAVSAVKGKEKT